MINIQIPQWTYNSIVPKIQLIRCNSCGYLYFEHEVENASICPHKDCPDKGEIGLLSNIRLTNPKIKGCRVKE